MEEFDLEKMITTNKVIDIKQFGTFLECTTDTNQRFRQVIPQGKQLNKNEKGEFILQDLSFVG